MRIRQEQTVLIASLVLLGWMVRGSLVDDTGRRRREPRGRAVEFTNHPAPEVDRALADDRDPSRLSRALFEAPRDTRPLPPLALEAPPLEPTAALRPPAGPGPEPRLFGDLLRGGHAPAFVAGLFDEVGADEGGAGDEEIALAEPVPWKDLTPEERMERIAGYRRLYDWVRFADLKWGRIANRDRFRLAERRDEPLMFVEFDPATGVERFPGQEPIAYPRERIEEFGFAETLPNELEQKRLAFGETLTPGQLLPALAFADWCVEHRLDAERALEVAEEFYRRAEVIADGDPAPALGLASCYEAGFRFEQAFGIYSELVTGDHTDHPDVLARLARLEARFRLFDRAEERLAAAERFGRSSWEVQHIYGRFLLDRGRAAEAVEHLEVAHRFEPTSPEHQGVRADIRTALGDALLATGDPDGALGAYTKALGADEGHQGALAGVVSVHYLEGGGLNGSAPPTADAADEGAGFDLLLATGLAALGAGEWAAARDKLELAAGSDPRRAFQAWRALSYLAEITGYPEEALDYAEQANRNDPTDVYSLIRLGRLLAQRDDMDGALAAFTAALDRELDLPDVLAAMGELTYAGGDHEAAERYLERSIALDDAVAGVHVLRGLNRLDLGRPALAQESFERALGLERTHPVATNGVAWCAYALGDSTEAMTIYREVDDARRQLSEEDPHRVYARAQIERIADHEEKVVWTDRFEREQLKNAWLVEQSERVSVALVDGAVWIEGSFPAAQRARLKREYNAGDFVSLEAIVTIHSGTRVRAGLFVSLEQFVRGQYQVRSEVTLTRHHDGMCQTRFMRRGQDDLPYTDVGVIDWADDEPKVLRIERYGESKDTRFRLLVDGIPVIEDVPVPTLGRTVGKLWVGVFAEGEPGRSVKIEIDDIEVVKRER
ncbi:MAG: tetratricopeptide repeat protein [Planctomycetota bacterium]|nr:tetratricopeptide repeat protein [Planctomycetota bacterium]MDP6761887.1 tetratricopeptide repeat protein [Planctomycetota bacterium]MDP6987959.1 tetratricopeptide repeat protein [Planctomycetota bacterium]